MVLCHSGIDKCAAVAQLVERWSVDPEVDGSNPSSRTIFIQPIQLAPFGRE